MALATPAAKIAGGAAVVLQHGRGGAHNERSAPARPGEKGPTMSGNIGEVAPDFTLPSANHDTISLSQFRGQQYVILSFHVFNFTAGCTTQAATLRQYYPQLQDLGAQVLGVSCDHVASSRAWVTALGGLPYPELSDWEPKGQISRTYDLYNPERGASQRAILILDKEGIIRYRRVYSAPHLPDMEEIVRVVQQLAAATPPEA